MINAYVEVDMKAMRKYQASIDNQLAHRENGPVEKALKKWAWRYRSFVQQRFDTYSKGGGNWKPLARTTVAGRRKKGGGTHGDTMHKIAVLEAKKKYAPTKTKGKKSAASVRVTLRVTGKKGFFSKGASAKSLTAKQMKSKSVLNKGRRSTKHNSSGAKGRRSKVVTVKAITKKDRRGLAAKIAKLKKSIRVSILRDTGILFQALQPTFANRPGAFEGDIPFGVRVGYGGPATHPGSRLSVADIAAVHQNGLGNVPKREIIVAPIGTILSYMADDMAKALKQLDNGST